MSVDRAITIASELRGYLDEKEREQGDRGQVLLDSFGLEHLHVELDNIREELEEA